MPGRMAEAARWKDMAGIARPDKLWIDGLPGLVFVSDMADALSEGIDFEYLLTEIIESVTSELGRLHQWRWLTKRPARMAKFSAWLKDRGITWPAGLWAGTSITSMETATRVR